jgi:hypothetical protein
VPRSTIHLACAEALAELESRVGKEGRRKFEKFLRHRLGPASASREVGELDGGFHVRCNSTGQGKNR